MCACVSPGSFGSSWLCFCQTSTRQQSFLIFSWSLKTLTPLRCMYACTHTERAGLQLGLSRQCITSATSALVYIAQYRVACTSSLVVVSPLCCLSLFNKICCALMRVCVYNVELLLCAVTGRHDTAVCSLRIRFTVFTREYSARPTAVHTY